MPPDEKIDLSSITKVTQYFQRHNKVNIEIQPVKSANGESGMAVILSGLTYPLRFLLADQGFIFVKDKKTWVKGFYGPDAIPEEPNQGPSKIVTAPPSEKEIRLRNLLNSIGN